MLILERKVAGRGYKTFYEYVALGKVQELSSNRISNTSRANLKDEKQNVEAIGHDLESIQR